MDYHIIHKNIVKTSVPKLGRTRFPVNKKVNSRQGSNTKFIVIKFFLMRPKLIWSTVRILWETPQC